MATLSLTRSIVEGSDGQGCVRFKVTEGSLPVEATLKPHQIVIRVEASPINPADISQFFNPSYAGIGKFDGVQTSQDANGHRVTDLPLLKKTWKKLQGSKTVGRVERRGIEGAGVVVMAGSSSEAQALKGKLVAFLAGRGSYAQHITVNARAVMVHQADTTAADAASSFVNPLTALSMVKTMHEEKHTAIVHTAAASQLGQMLLKICNKDGIQIVNIVRRPAQVELLKSLGAQWVVDSSAKTYEKDLVEALVATRATICFDATGGGSLAYEIIKGMETAATRCGDKRNPYGTSTMKKFYFYGGLNAGQPMMLRPFVGMGGFSWSMAGYLPTVADDAQKKRVAREIKTTFATTYKRALTLDEVLDPAVMKAFQAQQTGCKYLVTPQRLGSAL